MTGVRILFVLAMFGAQGAIAADTGSPGTSPELRQRAEDLAGAASQRFTDILDTEHKTPATHDPLAARNALKPATGSLAPVWDWLTRSAQSYDEIVIAQLKAKDDWTTIVERDAATSAPAQQAAPQVVPELRGWNGLLELVRYWLARANSTYRTEIVTPLRMPFGTPAPSAPSPMTASASGTGAAQPQQAEKQQAEEAIRREAEAADKQRREAEAADSERRAAEEQRIAAAAEEKRKAQEEARARLIAESEVKRKAAEAEAEKARLAAEEQRAAEETAARRKADEAEAKRIAEAETAAAARRKAEEDAKIAAAEADAAERRAVAEAEAQAKRQAEIDAEATRRMQAAANAKGPSRAEQVPAARTASGPVTGPVPPFPAAVTQESSDIAIAPAVPEKKPSAPDKTAKVVAKSREEITDEAVEPVAKPSKKPKVTAAKSSRAGKHVYAKKSKRRIAFKKAPRRHRKPHFGRRNWSAGSIVVGRHCACRCGRILLKPRKHRYANRLMHAPKHRVTRRHRAVQHGGHWGRVTYRHRLHYID
ncbi:conserved exported protein of unknown function [Hyphomicrobium sp. 1Nfss2.1]|uniref:hypothetical protein n=1 Tax=Hyphomicrobium sp. 1Nfss2.1 TaxID=3413936 RepID=UPI003C7A651D